MTNPGNKTGVVGRATSLQISASDSGSAKLNYSATRLPTGMLINASSGAISGAPSAVGAYSVTTKVSDSTGVSRSASFTWTIASAPPGCSGQKLVNPGFESGTSGWTTSAGVIRTDRKYAHTGAGYARLGGYGTKHTDTLAQAVTIPPGCSATMTFNLYINSSETTSSQPFDKLTLAANAMAVQGFSNLNKGSGYVPRSVSLTSFAGQTVTMMWTGTEDSYLQTSFLIDDTAVTLQLIRPQASTVCRCRSSRQAAVGRPVTMPHRPAGGPGCRGRSPRPGSRTVRTVTAAAERSAD